MKTKNQDARQDAANPRAHPPANCQVTASQDLPEKNDKNGIIIEGAPNGGTVDSRVTNWWSYFWGHRREDVEPFDMAEKLNRIQDYFSVRPSW